MGKCDGCGKPGKPKDPTGGATPSKWACSASCAEKIMKEPGWSPLGWIKV